MVKSSGLGKIKQPSQPEVCEQMRLNSLLFLLNQQVATESPQPSDTGQSAVSTQSSGGATVSGHHAVKSVSTQPALPDDNSRPEETELDIHTQEQTQQSDESAKKKKRPDSQMPKKMA